jgi:hypothetical protein
MIQNVKSWSGMVKNMKEINPKEKNEGPPPNPPKKKILHR